MAEIDGARLVARCLKQQGIDELQKIAGAAHKHAHDEIHRNNRDIDPGQRLVGEMRRGLDHNPPSPLPYAAAHLAADLPRPAICSR